MNLEISCIYFIQSGITNLFKIGYTRNLKTRLAELQVGNPEIFTVRGFIKVSYDILLKEEKIVQDYFKEHLSRAEWYIFESFEIVEKYIKRKNGELLTESFVDKSLSVKDFVVIFSSKLSISFCAVILSSGVGKVS